MAVQTVPFETMGQPEFDRVVEALLVTEFSGGGFTAQALDGRGGDGGIDVGVWDPQGKIVRIFQLKYFPEGFSGLHGRRRQQVKDSFNTAWENHQPARWTLVLPRNPTREEQDYVLRLAAGHHAQVDIFGRAELDNLLGKHPHLLDYFAKDRALELLTAVHRPEEVLAHRDDIGVVLDRVHSGTDAQSPHWGWGYHIDAHGNQLHYLVAKHPDAHLAEPLFVDMKATFSAATEVLHDQLDRAQRFGVAETIVLPNSVVPSIVHRGADWFAGEKKVTEVHLVPSDTGAGTPVTLVAEDANGVQLGSIPGTVKRFTQGGEGGQLIVDFIGGLTAHWVIPTADDAPPQDVTFVTGSAGAPVREVRRLTRFMSRFDDARRAIVRVKGQEFLAFNLGGGDRHTPDPAFVAFLDDLVAIENALDVEFMFPEKGVSTSDRRWAATFREVLRGNAAPMPSVDGYNMTLDGGYDDTLLAQLRSDAGRWFARKPHFTHKLLGVDIVITDICIYQHEAAVVGGDEHAKALVAGQGQGRRVHVASEKNLPWLLCKPDLMPAELDAPELVGWSVPGVEEHHGLAALRKMLPALKVTPLRRQV